MMHAGADLYWDEEQRVPYVFLGDQWAGFDSVRSIVEKVVLCIHLKPALFFFTKKVPEQNPPQRYIHT